MLIMLRLSKTLVGDINFDFDSLVVHCVTLSDEELIPGTDDIKQNKFLS